MTTDFNETPGTSRYRKPSVSLGELWRTKPIFKLVVVVVGVAGAALAANSYFSNSGKPETSILPAPATVPDTRETGEASPEFVKAVQQQDQNVLEQARATGGSALPTPIQTPVMNPSLGGVTDDTAKDTLREFEETIQDRVALPREKAQPIQPVAPPIPPEAVQALQQKMLQQIQQMQREWESPSMKTMVSAEKDDRPTAADETDEAPIQQLKIESKAIIPSGAVHYGQMLTEANSDVPGPVVGQVLSGPLSGARLIGSFETFRNHLVIHFKTISFRRKEVTADILVLDPNTTLGGVATEVDPRYLTRVLLPAASEFIKGFASGLSEDQSTVTISGTGGVDQTTTSTQPKTTKDAMYQGLEKSADKVGQFLEEEAGATKRLVRVAVGTPVGLLFVKSVTECDLKPGCQNVR